MTNLSGEEFFKRFENDDKLGSLFKHKILSLTKTECISQYNVDKNHFNPNGILHGGTLFSVMDSAQGAFVHYILDEKFKYAATGTATIKFLAPVTNGLITLKTTLKEIENRKLFIHSSATDEEGKEVAYLNEIWIATLK